MRRRFTNYSGLSWVLGRTAWLTIVTLSRHGDGTIKGGALERLQRSI